MEEAAENENKKKNAKTIMTIIIKSYNKNCGHIVRSGSLDIFIIKWLFGLTRCCTHSLAHSNSLSLTTLCLYSTCSYFQISILMSYMFTVLPFAHSYHVWRSLCRLQVCVFKIDKTMHVILCDLIY